jgi:hypothetical protein
VSGAAVLVPGVGVVAAEELGVGAVEVAVEAVVEAAVVAVGAEFGLLDAGVGVTAVVAVETLVLVPAPVGHGAGASELEEPVVSVEFEFAAAAAEQERAVPLAQPGSLTRPRPAQLVRQPVPVLLVVVVEEWLSDAAGQEAAFSVLESAVAGIVDEPVLAEAAEGAAPFVVELDPAPGVRAVADDLVGWLSSVLPDADAAPPTVEHVAYDGLEAVHAVLSADAVAMVATAPSPADPELVGSEEMLTPFQLQIEPPVPS